MEYGVISFDSTHAAMLGERYFGGLLPVKVMPTPRIISKSCGISLRFEPSELQTVVDAARHIELERNLFDVYIINEQNMAHSVDI